MALLLCLRGTPFLYYGEEIGMRDGLIPPERVRDPVGKRFPAVNRDPERTPMQWSPGPGAGFTTAAEAWLPLGPDADTVNVTAQLHEPRSHLSFYRRLLAFRKQTLALRRGTYRALDSAPDTFVYVREHEQQRVLVALNFADEPRCIGTKEFPTGLLAMSTDSDRNAGPVQLDGLELHPSEGISVKV